MATHSLFLLPGDGIGTEIMVEVEKLIAWTNAEGPHRFSTESGLAGGAAYDAHGVAITDEDVAKARRGRRHLRRRGWPQVGQCPL